MVYLKMAIGNIKRNMLDFLVYFVTLCVAVCLLYSFTASADYLASLDLTADQRAVYGSSGDALRAFSALVVIVFASLIAYTNRFIVRRRKHELGVYALLGMTGAQISSILAVETFVICAIAFITGVIAGVSLSPVFSAVASYVFGVSGRLSWTFSADAAIWTAGCFIVLIALSAFAAARSAARQPLSEQLNAQREYVSRGCMSPAKRLACILPAIGMLAATWYLCSATPGLFVTLLLPIGLLALAGTYFLIKPAPPCISSIIQRFKKWYLRGVRPLAIHLGELSVSKSALPLSCACVMTAAATCMICAGLAFSVGMRSDPSNASAAIALAPIGYVGILYGATFLVASFAVTSLHQIAFFVDVQKDLATSHLLGVDAASLRRVVMAQTATGFVTATGIAVIHDLFGFGLVRFLSDAIGAAGFTDYAVITAAVTIIIGSAYYILSCLACFEILKRSCAA